MRRFGQILLGILVILNAAALILVGIAACMIDEGSNFFAIWTGFGFVILGMAIGYHGLEEIVGHEF